MTEELKRNCKLCAITTLGQDEYIDCLEEQYEELEKENEELKFLSEKMETWINRIRELKEENEKLKAINKKMECCANCKHGTQSNCEDYPVAACLSPACECLIKSPTKNSAGKYHDWNDKCDNWEWVNENNTM